MKGMMAATLRTHRAPACSHYVQLRRLYHPPLPRSYRLYLHQRVHEEAVPPRQAARLQCQSACRTRPRVADHIAAERKAHGPDGGGGGLFGGRVWVKGSTT